MPPREYGQQYVQHVLDLRGDSDPHVAHYVYIML